MIVGRAFPNQTVTPEAYGALFAGIVSDGILRGCDISYSGKTLTVTPGHFVVAGRELEIITNETISVTGTSGFARIRACVNTAATSTRESFEQFGWAVDYAATADGFPALTQGDINGGSSTLYEAAFCTVSLGEGITGIVSRMGRASARGCVVLDTDPGEGVPVDYPDGVLLAIV